ncbi:MAG: SHOCT domain-containing protein [Candidatus Diapherotrites archaeon]
MKKLLLLFFVLIFSSIVLADSPEEAIEKYYSSSAAENLEEYFSVTDLTGLDQEDIALEKRIVELMWNTIDEQTYSITEKETVIDEAGENALVQFKLSASYKNMKTGEATSFTEMAYIALLSKQGNWKIVYSVPMKEYLELRQRTVEMKAIEAEMESFIEQNPKEEGKLLVDGKPWDGNGTGDGILEGSLLGLIDSAILGVEIVIAVLVLLLVVSFFKGGKKEDSAPSSQQVVVNVNASETQTQKPAAEAKQPKPAEQAQSAMTKKEFSESMKILRKRYASGEITKKQFNEMKKDLGN